MLKTLSAALLAASVIAAPALAATTGKTTAPAPVMKAEQTKSKALNANAGMVQHRQVRHHRHHKMTSLKAHSKVSAGQHAPANTRKPG